MDNYQIDSYSGAEIEALLGKIDDLGNASQSSAGLMSAADKTKLDGLDSGAQANVLEGVKIAGADLPITEKKVNIPADSSPTSGSNSLVRSGGVFNAIKDFITRSVNDLVNYYTKTEVNNIIGSLQQFHYEIYASTSAVANPQSNVLYLIGPTGTGSDKYEEYVYSNGWVKIGDTTIDLSGYSTTEQMNAAINNALEDYATKEEVSQLGQERTLFAKKYEAQSIGFKDVPCPIIKGDRIFIVLEDGAVITDIYQRPSVGSSTGQVLVPKVQTEDGYYIVATIDAQSLYIYFDASGKITIKRDAINSEKIKVKVGDLSEDVNSYLYPKTTRVLTANTFNEIPCSFLTGDKVFIELGENTEIGDIYQRPILGSSTGQQLVSKVTTESGYYLIATIDFNSLYIWCDTVGSVTIKRDKIDDDINVDAIPEHSIGEEKLSFDLSPLKEDKVAEPITTFVGPYPQFAIKMLAGKYWETYIFDVQGVEKVKVIYRSALPAYGIAFSTKGDSVNNFNSGTNANWWYSYPDSSGEIEINVPDGAKYLALAKRDARNSCIMKAFVNLSSVYRNNFKGKTCIYIGDSISTENNYRWKGLLESEYGLKYVRGGAGLWPANGGIKLCPPQTEPDENGLKSIWYRCANQRMNIYSFDIISLFGGTNDMINSGLIVGDVDADGNYVDIADIVPYVDDASSFATPANYNDVWRNDLSYAECLKGCLEMLHRDFPTKPIMLCTVLPCGGYYGNWVYNKSGSPMDGVIMSERMAIVATRIAEYYFRQGWNIYAVPFYWGVRTITSISAFTNWLDPQYGGGVDGVHPNRVCAIRMVDCVRESLIMLKS